MQLCTCVPPLQALLLGLPRSRFFPRWNLQWLRMRWVPWAWGPQTPLAWQM